MAEAVTSLTLESLSNLLKNEVKFSSGVSAQVREIHNEFEWMQCFLRDVDARKDQDERLKKWVKDISSLAYRAENATEMYAAKVSSRRERGIKKVLKRFACILSEAIARRKVGAEIANIEGEINHLTRSLQTYGVKPIDRGEGTSSGNEKQRLLRKTYGHQVEKYFVGMKDDTRDLLSVIKDNRRHRVVSIWAMGGAGKTTIAQKIYNHEDVRRRFDGFAWACITQECQFQSVFKDILKQLTLDETKRKEIDSKAPERVVGELYQLQKEKRCLIVLDNIWKLDDWRCLQPAFPTDASCSKILLTTRIKDVAEVGFLHELKSLKEDEALELLRKKAFPEDVGDLPEFETLGKEMVKKCGNHPLAVSVIGGILSRKNSVSDWKMVNDNMDSYLKRSEQNKERILQVLALSYNELPYNLKLCFLYLGIYEEFSFDHVERLYCMWMAEGIVLSKDRLGNESMMDVAERYLDELSYMSMVQVEIDKFDLERSKKTCRLHDLMRDLWLEKAKEEEFFELRRYLSEDGLHIDPVGNSDLNNVQLRSLFCDEDCNLDFLKKPSCWFGKFKFVRILFFKSVEFKDTGIPKDIGKLIHLRLLIFMECDGLTKLPSAIGDLTYLQTLGLYVTGEIEIPNVLWKLKRLRHLYVFAHWQIKGKDKLRLDGLGELEVLCGFDSKKMEAGDLSKLTKLHHFEAKVSEVQSLSLVMNSIEHIKEKHLSIECDFLASTKESNLSRQVLISRNLQILCIDRYIGKLPNYEPNFFQDLVRLELRGSHIEEDPMQMLEMLPNLETLVLKSNAYVGKEMSCRAMGFSKLKSLWVSELNNLEKWSMDKGAMSSLFVLRIAGCPKLEMIPDGLKFIKTLRELFIWRMPPEFRNRIRLQDGGEGVDFDKVSHVPDIQLW